ncbi:hypothetical protein [Ralstonia pseudosolanacearum]|uniref:hypothetical protein n=1 Tax=Ralstonia pseudosolanacearum TaxID=1310165 RepID=UPI001FF8AC38|nr:hypothetical protein [Ralstonia pseudosolanacearum]
MKTDTPAVASAVTAAGVATSCPSGKRGRVNAGKDGSVTAYSGSMDERRPPAEPDAGSSGLGKLKEEKAGREARLYVGNAVKLRAQKRPLRFAGATFLLVSDSALN